MLLICKGTILRSEQKNCLRNLLIDQNWCGLNKTSFNAFTQCIAMLSTTQKKKI